MSRPILLTARVGIFACLACSSPQPDPPSDPGIRDYFPTALGLEPLPAQGDASLPRAVGMQLDEHFDVFRVRVHARARNLGGEPFRTECQMADIWRVGAHAVDWAVGTAFVLPLDYGAGGSGSELPDGNYTATLEAVASTYDAWGKHGESGATPKEWPFSVANGELEPMSTEDYMAVLQSFRRIDEAGVVFPQLTDQVVLPDPCPSFVPPSDLSTLEEATTVVDLDAWGHAGSQQPFRLEKATRKLSYQAVSDSAQLMSLSLPLPSEVTTAPVDIALAPGAGLELAPYDPNGRQDLLGSTSGSARVRLLDDGRLSVELFDVVLANYDQSRNLRIDRGSIIGDWIERP